MDLCEFWTFKIWTKSAEFCMQEFFDTGNSNLKEFFDFDHGKVPHTRVKPNKRIFSYYEVPLCKPFLTKFSRSRTKTNGGFVFSA